MERPLLLRCAAGVILGGAAASCIVTPLSAPKRRAITPPLEFYRDWAHHQFGPTAAEPIAGIFTRIDGKLPRPVRWGPGPGNLYPDRRPWEEVRKEYAFAGELEALQPLVTGGANRERFEYWLEQFRAMRAMARLNCTWGQLDKVMEEMQAESDANHQIEIARTRGAPSFYRGRPAPGGGFSTTCFRSSAMEANWASLPISISTRFRRSFTKHVKNLKRFSEIPCRRRPCREWNIICRPASSRRRSPRIFTGKENVELRVILLSEENPSEAALWWREMGEGDFVEIPLEHIQRSVYSVELPLENSSFTAVEWYIRAIVGDAVLLFPPRRPKSIIRWSGCRNRGGLHRNVIQHPAPRGWMLWTIWT